MPNPRILLLFAHPAIRRSRVNRVLLSAARDVEGVRIHDLYETYPDFAIDVDFEQALLAEHDIVVAQHPFYWYSAPAIFKEWLDLVLEYNFAYGEKGRALEGKSWMSAVTTGGLGSNYGPGTPNLFTVEELLRPYEATAHLCRMRWLAPFIVHGTHTMHPAEIVSTAHAYRARLAALAALKEEGEAASSAKLSVVKPPAVKS